MPLLHTLMLQLHLTIFRQKQIRDFNNQKVRQHKVSGLNAQTDFKNIEHCLFFQQLLWRRP